MKCHHLFLILLVSLFPAKLSAFYDPGQGRWLSRDPIEEDGGTQLYAILGNDTVSATDHLGLKITRYREDTNLLPLIPSKVPGYASAYENGIWFYKGVCNGEELAMIGHLTITITIDPTVNETTVLPKVKNRSGLTIAQHERYHAWIEKKFFNLGADIADGFEGEYCPGCCVKAKELAEAYMQYANAIEDIQNATFDLRESGRFISPFKRNLMRLAKIRLSTAWNAYISRKCQKL